MKYAYNHKPPKVESACSSDQTRPALAAVYFDAERGELQATDSYCLARVPVEVGSDETSGYVQPEALKASRKRDAGGLHLNGAVDVMPAAWDNDSELAPLQSFPREDRGQFPNVDQLWPVGVPLFTVGINAGILKRLADALGADDGAISITFPAYANSDGGWNETPNPLRPMLVRPINGADKREAPAGGLERAEGLIMPIRVSE